MNHNCVIIRYGEIGLKGKNRAVFENKLVSNIKLALNSNKIESKVVKKRGRIFVYSDKKIIPVLKNVFGIVNLSYAYELKADIEEINKKAMEIIKSINFKTFRVTCQRMNKEFPLKSPEIEKLVGEQIFENANKKVDLKNPDLNLQLEIMDNAYIFTEKQKAVGGLPIGIAGTVLCLIENEKSLLAAYLAMKRGCKVIPVILKENKIDINLLKKYDPKIEQKEISNIKEIDALTEKTNSKALVIAQTLDQIEDLGIKTTLLRPLTGYEDSEIQNEIKKIKQN